MRNIRKALRKHDVKTQQTDVFIQFLIDEVSLNDSAYDTLILFNKSLTDSSCEMQAFSKLIACIEPTLKAIIKHFKDQHSFATFYTSISTVYKDPTYKNYLEYAANRIINGKIHKIPNSRDVTDAIDDVRNSFIHYGGIPKIKIGGKDVDIKEFCIIVFAFLAKFYSTYHNPYWLEIIPVRWSLLRIKFMRIKWVITDIWNSIKDIYDKWKRILKDTAGTLLMAIVTTLKWIGAVVVAGVIMSGAYWAWKSYNSIPFEKASYEDIKDVSIVEWAHMHKKRASIAGRLRYFEGQSKVANKIHTRTAELNKYADSWSEYPDIVEYYLPIATKVPLFRTLNNIITYDNALREIPQNYSSSHYSPHRYDNPIEAELYGSCFLCEFIDLEEFIVPSEEMRDEVRKFEKLVEIVKGDPNMSLIFVFNPRNALDSGTAETVSDLLQRFGIKRRQIEIMPVEVTNGPKLYIRMDKRF